MSMNSWFDIKSLEDVATDEDVNGMLASRQTIQSYIDAEQKDHAIDPQRIVIGGFSQGIYVVDRL